MRGVFWCDWIHQRFSSKYRHKEIWCYLKRGDIIKFNSKSSLQTLYYISVWRSMDLDVNDHVCDARWDDVFFIVDRCNNNWVMVVVREFFGFVLFNDSVSYQLIDGL